MIWQCWALFQLRWTLLRRSWTKNNTWGYALIGLLLVAGGVASLFGGICFYILGVYAVRRDMPVLLVLTMNGAVCLYLFFYAWGMLMDLQRADLIDFKKMLLLPVSLPMVYLMNFAVSLASPLSLFAVPGVFGLLLGVRHGYGSGALIVGVPLSVLFMLMVNAWAYYVRGRLAILMENKRRRRIIFILLPLCFVALGQLPAVLSHLATSGGESSLSAQGLALLMPYLLLANAAFPIFWPVYGLWAFLSGISMWHVLLCVVGLCLCTLLGLRFGYITTLRHYMGVYDTSTKAPLDITNAALPRSKNKPFTAHRLPGLSDETAALSLAFYRSYARHPQVRLLLIMPLCLGLFFLIMYRTGAYGRHFGHETTWMPMAVLIWPFFNFSFFMFNIFGVDAPSFENLLLLPTARYKYLLAKNLSLAPFTLGLALFFVAVGALLIQAPFRATLLSLILVLHLYLFFCLVGNFLSIRFPYRIGRDALRLPTNRLRMLLVGLASSILAALMVAPASVCMVLDRMPPGDGGAAGAAYYGLAGAVLLLLISAAAYRWGLMHTGDQLLARENIVYARLHQDRE